MAMKEVVAAGLLIDPKARLFASLRKINRHVAGEESNIFLASFLGFKSKILL